MGKFTPEDDALLQQRGVDVPPKHIPITQLRHVRSSAEKKAVEEIANRQPCKNFKQFKPLFQQVAQEIQSGIRKTTRIRKQAGFSKTTIQPGSFFILNGQAAFVAEVGDEIKAPNGETDARLRVIYSNGTESNILLRSLQRALYKDETSRLISNPSAAGTLYSL